MNPKINDTVMLTCEIVSESLPRKATGVIVAEFFDPEEAYEVEFCDAEGVTISQIVLRSDQFILLS